MVKFNRFLLLVMLSLVFISCKSTDRKNLSNAELYEKACLDAKTSSDIFPLITITPEEKLVYWNDSKDKVLMFSWHHYPDSYKPGAQMKNSWGEMWLMSLEEMKDWYKKNNSGVTDWTVRFCQLIGLPEAKGHSHFSAVWVKPADLLRPAYETDITKQMTKAFDKDFAASEEGMAFIQWFDKYQQSAYNSTPAYPWTRYGYTYDWAGGKTKKGLAEFLLKKNSDIQVEFTKTNEEFVEWLKKQNF